MKLLLKLPGAPAWLKPVIEGLDDTGALAAAYGYRLCSSEGCDPWLGLAAAAARAAGTAPQGLPRHARDAVEKALAEADEAYLRSPTSIYAQVALDAEALALMGVLSLIHRGGRGLGEILQEAAVSMSYAAASDYILYTRTAKRMAQTLKPHTLAAAKWLTEELAHLGVKAVPRTETSAAGIVSYIDLLACPCGRADKMATVKPEQRCMRYSVEYNCCGEKLRISLCSPESTRTR